jgi:nitrogenase subunit NifH
MDQIAVYQKGGIAMNKAVRTALIAASSLVLAGALLIGAASRWASGRRITTGDDISDIFLAF